MKTCLGSWCCVGGVLLSLSFNGRVQGQSSPLDFDPSLKLHLDFDEDFSGGKVLDVTGNSHDGWQFDPTNNIAATTGVFGTTAGQWTYKFNQTDGVHIYPASQYLGVTNLAGIRYLTNATISLWARFDTNGDLGMQLLSAGYAPGYSWGGPAAATNGWFFGRTSSPYLGFVIYAADGAHTIVTWPDDADRLYLFTTKFHLYTVTLDCTKNQAIAYYDGQAYTTNTIGFPWIRIYGTGGLPWLAIGTATMDGTPQWGDDLYPNSAYFVGLMDDLRIYNRALSGAEVQSLYRGSTYAQNLAIQAAAPQSVQVRWDTKSNAVYQVEYLTNLTDTTWVPLRSAIPGSVTNSIIDSILGQPTRFYRVRVLP